MQLSERHGAGRVKSAQSFIILYGKLMLSKWLDSELRWGLLFGWNIPTKDL